MTVTTIYEQGSLEPLEETVRGFIARNWLKANTFGLVPHFASPHGEGKEEADYNEMLTKNDVESLQVDGLILFVETEERHMRAGSGRGKSGKRKQTTINVTMYAPNRRLLVSFQKEFNRILSDYRPHTALRIKKTDVQSDSAIAYFTDDQMTWAKPRTFEDTQHLIVTSGLLLVNWLIVES